MKIIYAKPMKRESNESFAWTRSLVYTLLDFTSYLLWWNWQLFASVILKTCWLAQNSRSKISSSILLLPVLTITISTQKCTTENVLVLMNADRKICFGIKTAESGSKLSLLCWGMLSSWQSWARQKSRTISVT